MDATTLAEILQKHSLWLQDAEGGERANLIDAYLIDADLTRANLTRANLTRANLTRANLTGANLNRANLTRADLTDVNLTGANLNRANLTRAYLNRANLIGANLSGANLTDAYLSGANLTRANLTGALINGVKIGDIEVPIVPNLDARILADVEADRAQLKMSEWHDPACKTTHCRAGHAINYAGEVGYALEKVVGSAMAGALIYNASCPTMPIPNFYASDDDAMQDIRERAGHGC